MQYQTPIYLIRTGFQLYGAPETIGIGDKGRDIVDSSLESGCIVALTMGHDQYGLNCWDGQLRLLVTAIGKIRHPVTKLIGGIHQAACLQTNGGLWFGRLLS